jgi:hypothetical protein
MTRFRWPTAALDAALIVVALLDVWVQKPLSCRS